MIFLPLRNINAEDDKNKIEGTWIIVAAELGGRSMPIASFNGAKLVLNSGRYVFHDDFGTYKLIPVETPQAMDISGTEGPNKGKTFLAIYKLAGDSMTICYDLEGKVRPKEFKAEPGTRQFLVSYKREKE